MDARLPTSTTKPGRQSAVTLERTPTASSSATPNAGDPVRGFRDYEIPRSSRFSKRSFVIIGAGLGLLVLSPFLVAIAAAIRLSSPAPVLFRQQRVGRRGREFTMLKFRTMVSEADQL